MKRIQHVRPPSVVLTARSASLHPRTTFSVPPPTRQDFFSQASNKERKHRSEFLSNSNSNITPIARPKQSEELPFAFLESLLKSPPEYKLSISKALDAVPPSIRFNIEWPLHILKHVLRLPANHRSLVRIFPLVSKTPLKPSLSSLSNATVLLTAYIRAVSRSRSLVLLPTTVDAFISLADKAIDFDLATKVGEDVKKNSISRSLRFIRALAGWDAAAWPCERATDLPKPVQAQIVRVISHLLAALERIPSSSSAPSSLTPSFLETMFSSRYLTGETMTLLLDHCERRGIALSQRHWRQCAAVAIELGTPSVAVEYLARAADGLDVPPENRIMAARITASFESSMLALQPLIHMASRGSEQKTCDSELQTAVLEGDRPEKLIDQDALTAAWSVLLSRSVRERELDADTLLSLANAIPSEALSARSLTPVMHGLLQRGDHAAANTIWQDLRRRHESALREHRTMNLDAAALSVGAKVLYTRELWKQSHKTAYPRNHRDPLAAPINLVDFYAARGTVSEHPDRVARSIRLDSQVLNVLLQVCSRTGRASVAFRLWDAAIPRWHVWPNDISLTLLLDTARLCHRHGFDPELDSFRGRLRALADAIRPAHSIDPATAKQWQVGNPSILLDPPGYSWRKENGAQQPWDRARTLFREIVLGNWPELADIPSPLDHRTGTLATLSSLFTPQTLPSGTMDKIRPPLLPGLNAKYPHVIPTATTFQSYIGMLGFFDHIDEIASALAWMRALQIAPTWRCMSQAMMYVGESEGPRRRIKWADTGEVRLVRDEEVLRHWLVEWLGSDAVPSEEDVATYRRNRVVAGNTLYLHQNK